MRGPREEWQALLETLEAMLSFTVEVMDETSKLQIRRYDAARSKLDELKDVVWGSEDCEKH